MAVVLRLPALLTPQPDGRYRTLQDAPHPVHEGSTNRPAHAAFPVRPAPGSRGTTPNDRPSGIYDEHLVIQVQQTSRAPDHATPSSSVIIRLKQPCSRATRLSARVMSRLDQTPTDRTHQPRYCAPIRAPSFARRWRAAFPCRRKAPPCVSVANSKFGPSTMASTGQASWQKPQ